MVIDQKESNSFTVRMIVKCLVEPEYFVFHFFHIKAQALIRKNQLPGTICYFCSDRNIRMGIWFCILDGIGHQVKEYTLHIDLIKVDRIKFREININHRSGACYQRIYRKQHTIQHLMKVYT